MVQDVRKIAFIGFGEAAFAFASGWSRPNDLSVAAYDLKMLDPGGANLVQKRCEDASVLPLTDQARALAGAQLVFSLVTADQALAAAQAASSHLDNSAFWLDCNSCAPQTKEKAAGFVESVGARYIDVAVMAPVHQKGHQVPLLLSGTDAGEAARLLAQLGMRPQVTGSKIGDASSVKMLRSVMVKGLEALTAECLLAARRSGVEDAVLASLQASDPGIDWRARGAYNMERMMVHGARRASEMAEVCVTLQGLGLPDWMSRGTVEWQNRIASLTLDPGPDDLALRSDILLDKL